MEKPKVLYVSQEIVPYLNESHLGNVGRYLPQGIQERGKEIRIFMPLFGNINERRNQLHEVIRLSGMNIIIDDEDHPLIIKVASIQSARMQIYFIDNDEYFCKKVMLHDKSGKLCEDNDEKAIFFARGVIETAQKLAWSPDIVHCHGWFTGMTPLYLKQVYKNNPLFADTKVVVSLYGDHYKGKLNKNLHKKLKFDQICPEIIEKYKETDYINYMKATIDLADGVIVGCENTLPELIEYTKKSKKPMLAYQGTENYIDAFDKFYDKVLAI